MALDSETVFIFIYEGFKVLNIIIVNISGPNYLKLLIRLAQLLAWFIDRTTLGLETGI